MAKKIKLLTVLGARPQFIKAGTVTRALSTGQASKIIVQELLK